VGRAGGFFILTRTTNRLNEKGKEKFPYLFH